MQNSIQFDAHYIDCGNACIAYYTFGQGEPLVLLHGNGEGSEYFAKCIPYLSRFYRVIAVDSRGHGKSERGEGKLNFDRMAEDLRMVFDGLGLERRICWALVMAEIWRLSSRCFIHSVWIS